MHHYPKSPGDYMRDAAHLTLLEHGAYNRLLDIYYATEKPFPLDVRALARKAGARSRQEAMNSMTFSAVCSFARHHAVQRVSECIQTAAANLSRKNDPMKAQSITGTRPTLMKEGQI